MKLHRLRYLLIALIAFALAVPAFPQASAINGQIEGTVVDPSGAVVPNAKIEIKNQNTGYARSSDSDASGFFRFTVLPLGRYTVTASAPGFRPFVANAVELTAGATATVNANLSVSGDVVQVEVGATAPVIEPGRTDLGFNLSNNQIENLPLVSRNNYNFILVQPNVSGHPNVEFGVPRKVNANGFTDRINYQLDGGNNTQSDRSGIRLLPISNTYIAEVQQVNNGFAPEFGNTVGTVFNAITKSGSNAFHGEAAYLFRRTDMVARSTLLARTAAKPEQNVNAPFVDAGGAIIKDKLFWFGSFEHIKRDMPSFVTVTPANLAALGLPSNYANAIPFGQNVYFVLGKGDWQITQNHRLSARYSYFRNESPYNNGGGLTVATQTYLFKDRAPAFATQLISTFGPSVVNEFRFQLPKRYQRQVAADFTGPQPVINISGVINFGGSDQTGYVFTERTPEYSENLTYVRGTHSYKFGADIRQVWDENTYQTFARYTFGSIQDYLDAKSGARPKAYTTYAQSFGTPQLNYNSLFSSFYVQDNWKLRPNLTVTYGVRYDVYKVPDANPSSPVATSQKFAVDKNNFGPRLGVSYALGRDQKTVVRANGGVFYDPPQTNTYQRALLNNGQPQYFNLSVAGSSAFAPAFPNILTALPTGYNLPVQDVTTVSPDFRTLYSTNANFQVSRELTSNMGLTATYLFTKGTHIPIYRNINLIPNGTYLADGRPAFGSGRIDTRFNSIIMNESGANSNYSGLNISVRRRFAQGYEWFATYTWSHAIDDAPEQNIIDSSTTNWLSDPTNRRRDRSNSFSDRRHALSATAVLNPTFKFDNKVLSYIASNNQLALMFVASSGDVFNIGSNRNLNGDPQIPTSQQRPLYIGRNTVRGQRIGQMDARYSRIFPIRERYKPEFFAEAWNLFNHSNVTGYNTTATVDTTGAILTAPSLAQTAALDPRLLQIGLKFSW
ncbi:MAG: TonB-dependent receptor [Acidobacteria bacterium]|nr:TonB-dependent receptor [Acidobacteriota bacterium]